MSRSSPFAEGLGPAAVYFAFRAGAFVAEALPPRVASALARAGGLLAHRIARKKRAVVARNYARVTGEGPHIRALVKEGFVSYAQYWLETFRLGRYSVAELHSMVAIDEASLAAINDAFAADRGVVLATGHIGFYDLGVAWIGTMGWPFTTVAEVLKPRALFEWFAEIRQNRGMGVIPAKPGLQARGKLRTLIESKEGVALLADRDLGRRGIWGEFFGEKTTFPAGPAILVSQTKASLLVGAIVREGAGFRVIFRPAEIEFTGVESDDLSLVVDAIAKGLEQIICSYPEQWHLFSTNWPSDEPHLSPRGRG
ncbi:MAG TPA: hypothetical protein VND22_10270 [Actinomycetota bacterium]|nr:hypothetical protein [Actinomycetota bacterium]